MFLGHTNLKLCISVNADVLTYAKSRNRENSILHNLKAFEKKFEILFDIKNNLS